MRSYGRVVARLLAAKIGRQTCHVSIEAIRGDSAHPVGHLDV
jgi:hypothetical protein